jgi:hypothetical protein
MGTVVGLTFPFGFGNVLNLALRLGVPIWVAPLIAPAVDLSILGLLLGTRHLALHSATPDQLRPARRLLIFASLDTLALNIADPVVAGDYGKAAFDAVGPALLQAIASVSGSAARNVDSDTLCIDDHRRVPQNHAGGRPNGDIGSAPIIDARSPPTPSAGTSTSAPRAQDSWYRSSEPNDPQARTSRHEIAEGRDLGMSQHRSTGETQDFGPAHQIRSRQQRFQPRDTLLPPTAGKVA